MNAVIFDPRPMDEIESVPGQARTDWIWDGLLGRGAITLLVSKWKAGKTTLLAGLLRALEASETFLGRPCSASRAIIVSEEAVELWAVRRRSIPIGPHVRLVSRPFAGRPTPEQWDELIRHVEGERERVGLDLLVVDTLMSFLPGRSDCNPGPVLDLLYPLRRLATSGVSVMLLHHPRKEPADEGGVARGSGALLGFVDIILELSRHGRMAADSCRRRIAGFSRHRETPDSLVYEWTPGTPDFRAVADVLTTRFKENWPVIESILAGRTSAATNKELLADWPPGNPAPSAGTLYEWLSAAAKLNLVVRKGAGTKNKPYRFRLRGPADEELDLSEFPTMEELDIPPRYRPGFEWPDDFSDDERRILGAPPRKPPGGA
jgi:hypothetical protein